MKSVLIIDDEDPVRSMLRRFFEKKGYLVKDAPNGKCGIEAFRKTPTDVAIIDIFMPIQEGLSTILTLHDEFPNVKIIAITGGSLGQTDYLQHARMFGAVETFMKPVELALLLQSVEQLTSS
ncbi:MAG: YesN/AraC family two-component response regulator [bacterium]|jgi:YesN/AraC family two-component response regulator